MTATSDFIAAVRIEIDDKTTPPSRTVRLENLKRSVVGSQINGANLTFYLNNSNLIALSENLFLDGVQVLKNGVFQGAATGTIDDANGIITITGGVTAPSVSGFATYSFNILTDADITQFLSNALGYINQTDIGSVTNPSGLYNAVFHKACSLSLYQMAAKVARLYDAQAGGKSLRKSVVPATLTKLAQAHEKQADDERAMYYKRQGRREAPAFGQFAMTEKVFTPKR